MDCIAFVAGLIVWAIAGEGLPQQLSTTEVLAMLGGALSAVDGFNARETHRARAAQASTE
jgi:hypothetical protein